MNTNTDHRLGVDFGRVIHGASAPSGVEDTVFLQGGDEQALRSPPTEGAFDVLPRLVELFGGRVWIISKCGERIQRRTLRWLAHQDFYERTGMPPGNVRFCRKRADKALHCAELGITHMIDDRLDVHRALRGLVPYRYLFGHQSQPAPAWVRAVLTWAEAETAVTADIAAALSGPARPRSR
ncbi:hypothetical protein [Actinomadura alba]|uniref:Uncharacterized protein n=1 Tax=Actinomadura alba TaxID=406431 RepID=A0ABR7LGM7_9ACTN|nr:hypothetical protein [Actinomadura alba]MBC6463999.1 hypothetical protein [Actinomadura alba]